MTNEIEVIERDMTDIADRQQGGLLDTNTDNILLMAERADQYITAMNKIMVAALKITTELDWVLIGGQPYLQESGATKGCATVRHFVAVDRKARNHLRYGRI
jgi:hypothetical protein